MAGKNFETVATTKDENSLIFYSFAGHFRINVYVQLAGHNKR